MADDAMADLAQVQDLLEELRSTVGGLQARVADLEAENASLRSAPAPPSPAADAMGRRHLIRAGLAAAGAASAGVLVAGAQPAAAVDGQPLVTRSQNQGCASATGIAVTSSTAGYGLGWIDQGVTAANLVGTNKPSIVGHAKGTAFDTGVRGSAEGINTGVHGVSANGVGVRAVSTNSDAIVATSTRGYALRATSTQGVVFAEGGGGGGAAVVAATATAPEGTAISASGMIAVSATSNDYAVYAVGTGGRGNALYAQSEEHNAVTASGLRGVLTDGTASDLWLHPGGARVDPVEDTIDHYAGEVVFATDTSTAWICTTAGRPGTWRRLSSATGALSVLAAPARVYDSRPGTAPTGIGPKTKFATNETRTFDRKANTSGVPAGATAALVTILLVNASATPGNLTIWANGVTKPLANTMVWGGSAGRFTATATTALDSLARVQVNASQPTDLVLDVVGFYR